MIVFDLECIEGHTFEGWFEDKKDLDNQMENALLQCPVCDSTSITKKVHPVSIKANKSSYLKQVNSKNGPVAQNIISEIVCQVAQHMEKNFEDVGASFADEALKMHYGQCEHKNIRGTTTKEEEKFLEKEGVPVFKFPIPKKQKKEEMN